MNKVDFFVSNKAGGLTVVSTVKSKLRKPGESLVFHQQYLGNWRLNRSTPLDIN